MELPRLLDPHRPKPEGLPPITTRYTLPDELTDEQRAFLDYYGFLHFEGVASREEVDMITSEMERLERTWASEGRASVNGIPLFFGQDPDGQPYLQRICFASMHSESIRAFVRDDRFDPIRRLIGDDARIGDDEKDGVVINRYINLPGSVYPRLGWHTDGLRDLFYGRLPPPQLNVGLHLDDCDAANGGLRLIPGSHEQGFLSMCFKKAYFVSHAPDPDEIVVETRAGDLTLHDGRLWHRVAQSTRTGKPSLRRSMYVPYLTGPYEPKSSESKTPAYHYLGRAARGARNRLSSVRRRLGR
jgi:hypothetical protein